MAFSYSKKIDNVAGIVKHAIFSFDSAGVTSGDIETGFSSILHISINNEVSEANGKAVASGGTVQLSSLTSNDTGTVSVFGI